MRSAKDAVESSHSVLIESCMINLICVISCTRTIQNNTDLIYIAYIHMYIDMCMCMCVSVCVYVYVCVYVCA